MLISKMNVSVAFFIFILMKVGLVSAYKVKLSRDEPELRTIYNNYRELLHDRAYFYLKSANLLQDSDIADHLKGDTRGLNNQEYMKAIFDFSSSELIRKYLNIKWYVPATDRTSVHIYDDPKEMDLASGPQVNQKTCGLLLDYMLHMVNKNYQHLVNSSELSIFNIMQSFGAPSKLNAGNSIFTGDYRLCMSSKLNVIRTELDKVNQGESERFFLNQQENEEQLSLIDYLSDHLRGKFGLWVAERDSFGLIEKSKNVLKLQPTRYCLAALRWRTWPNGSYYERNMVFRIGVCLPDKCDSKSLGLYHDKIRRLTEPQMIKRLRGFYINNLYCLPDEKSPLRNVMNYKSSRLFIYFNIVWFSLIILATSAGKCCPNQSSTDKNGRRKRPLWEFLRSWCLNENLHKFWMRDRDKNIKNDVIKIDTKTRNKIYLKPLEGVKVLSAICVILVHAIILTLGIAENGQIIDYIMSRTIIVSAATISEASVNNFFVLTGLITTLTLFRRPKWTLMRPTFWIQYFFYRYIRIVPMYLLVHWSLQSFARFLGSGPNWDYGTSYTAWGKVCENDSFWEIIIPMANFKSPTASCNPVGWYLANDIQFSLITPIVIILFSKNPLVAHLTILGSSFVIMVNHVKYYLSRPEPRHGLEFSGLTIAHVLNEPSDGYTNPQYRCISYLIGLSAGHILHLYETGSIGLGWPKGFVSGFKLSFWFVSGALILLPHLTTFLLPLDNEPLTRFLGSIAAGTLHGLTSLGASAFMLLICTGHFRPLARLFGKPFLQPIANCSLCTMLVHVPLIFYHIHALNSAQEISVYYILAATIIWSVESLILSAFAHVVYELPIRRFMTKFIFFILSYTTIKQ